MTPAAPATCPTCGKAVDPAHAPVARIRGTRVVTYCSAACADQASGAIAVSPPAVASPPVAAPAAPPSVAPPPSAVADPQPAAAPVGAARSPSPSGSTSGSASLSGAGSSSLSGSGPVSGTPSGAEPSAGVDPSGGGRRRRIGLVVGALIAAGGVALVVSRLTGDAPAPAEVDRPEVAAHAVERPGVVVHAPAAATAPGDLLARATAELAELMAAPSPRIRRLAALALARTGEPKALALLTTMLAEEPSTLTRVQIAYALARAGRVDGREHLVAGLGHERRDVRLDAARALVELGDDRGRGALNAMLTVESHKLGAAGLLARLGDERGTKLLSAELARASSEEIRMRAAVELGRAGDRSQAPALAAILAAGRYNVGAADALAALGDRAAIPALERQLELTAMRTSAARWLRKLGGPAPADLGALAAALEHGDEPDRASAAEAILILTGPPELAERE